MILHVIPRFLCELLSDNCPTFGSPFSIPHCLFSVPAASVHSCCVCPIERFISLGVVRFLYVPALCLPIYPLPVFCWAIIGLFWSWGVRHGHGDPPFVMKNFLQLHAAICRMILWQFWGFLDGVLWFWWDWVYLCRRCFSVARGNCLKGRYYPICVTRVVIEDRDPSANAVICHFLTRFLFFPVAIFIICGPIIHPRPL